MKDFCHVRIVLAYSCVYGTKMEQMFGRVVCVYVSVVALLQFRDVRVLCMSKHPG